MRRLWTGILSVALCLALLCTGCSRNYTGWNKIFFGNPMADRPDVSAEKGEPGLDDSQFAACFYVPAHWQYSRVGDYIFFASYEVTDLNQILRSNGQLYLVGFVNSNDGVNYSNHDLSEILNLSIPVESTKFHMQLYNGASYGEENYIYFGELVDKYFVSFQYDDFYTVKLVDWQGLCGKSLVKRIALSYQTNFSFREEALPEGAQLETAVL